MIDLHAHLLPEIDDGPQTLDEALEMLRVAQADGISKIVATPHILGQLNEDKCRVIEEKFEELKIAAQQDGLSIELHLAVEAFVTPDFSSLLKLECGTYGGRKKFLLMEFSFTDLPLGYDQIIRNILKTGAIPLIAHPERNDKIINNLIHAKKMFEAGALLQVTAGSILGEFGRKVQKVALEMLENDLIYVIASDAHSAERRPPVLSEAKKYVEMLTGEQTADMLFLVNPNFVLNAY
jgi:protein-tyrosine phosphatase